MKATLSRLLLQAILALALAAAAAALAQPPKGMPSPQEMDAMMKQMQRELDKLPPEQRKLLDQAQRRMPAPAAVADDSDDGMPRRDDARIGRVSRQPLKGAQLKAHVDALQTKLAQALSPAARSRAQAVEAAIRKEGGNVPARLAAAANGLAVQGAWPESTYLMGRAAAAGGGQAQDLNNFAAFLTMQRAEHAALPILITLDARYPNNATILNNLGQAWFGLGELNEAQKALALAVRFAPNHPQANATRSRIEQASGDRAAAQASMRKAIVGGYSAAKERRLKRLGGSLQRADLRWRTPMPQDALGLSKFVAPPYPVSSKEIKALTPVWQSFHERLRAELAKAKAKGTPLGRARAASAAAWIAEAEFRGPLSDKAHRLTLLNQPELQREGKRIAAAFGEAQQLQRDEERKLGQQIDAMEKQAQERYRNVPGGAQKDYICPQVRAALDKYLVTVNPRLEAAGNAWVEFHRRRIQEQAFLDQFRMTDVSFEIARLSHQSDFLTQMATGHEHGAARHGLYRGFMHTYGVCFEDSGKSASAKLSDFDELHCQSLVRFRAPGIGSIAIRCNRMDTTLDPVVLPFKANWTEDLNRDRVLSASAQVGIQGVTVGGRGEFDDQGLARGGVQVGAGVGDKAEIGGVEVNVGAGAAVGIEFDRSGITDVRIDAGVTASAGAGAVEVDVAVDSRWSWSAGASAQASGGFDASVF